MTSRLLKITSLTNSQVKDVVRLRDHKARKTTGLTLIEGFREVTAAQAAQVDFKELWICPQWLDANLQKRILKDFNKPGCFVYEVSKEVFAKISFGDRAEGILAVAKMPSLSLSNLKLKKNPLILVVEKVEKPGNLGAILRTADSAGVDAILVTDAATGLYNPNVIRASLGAAFSVAMVQLSNDEALDFLKKKNIKICSTLPQAKLVYTEVNFKEAFAIVLGSEQEGLSPFWVKNADFQVKIPMQGKSDSLNVATSAAIMIYEALRQRSSG